MKIRVVQFEANNAKPEIIVNYRTDINTGEEFISVAVRNHMDINPSFLDFVKKYAHQIKLASLERGNFFLYQNNKENWKIWLLKNIDETWSQSPYSQSYYNSKNITWSHKPEGSLRLSDHWNFFSTYDGKLHCQTMNPSFKDRWALGEYHHGKYCIIKIF